MDNIIKIESVAHLKELCENGSVSGYIQLNGNARSSKEIDYNEQNNTFWILNYIDDTEQNLTEEELFTDSNIGESIKLGTFYVYMEE